MLKRDNVLTKGVFNLWQKAAKSPSHKFFGFADEAMGYIGTNGIVVYRIPKEVNHPFKDTEGLPDSTKKKNTLNPFLPVRVEAFKIPAN